VAVHPYKKDLQELWKSLIRLFRKEPLVVWTTVISTVLWLGTLLLPIWRILPTASESPFVALHYNIYLGVDRFGPVVNLFFLPALGFFFLILNVLISAWAYRSQKILSFFFSTATPFLELILLAAMTLIVLINV